MNEFPLLFVKRNVLIVAASIGLLMVVFGLRWCHSRDGQTFQTATVTRGPITQAVTATGTLNPVVNVQV
ncbi:MAG: hypothetical protein M3O66_00265, partial [Verrucomicrobiota bacterium]|nr:hypothetical protein [Verrucomicrobiota bacterium]